MIGDAYHAQINDFAYTYEEVTHVVYSTDPYNELRFTHYDSKHLPHINAVWLQEGSGTWHGYIEYDDSDGNEVYKQYPIHKFGKTPHDALVNLINQLYECDNYLQSEGQRFIMRCLGGLQWWERVMKLMDNHV